MRTLSVQHDNVKTDWKPFFFLILGLIMTFSFSLQLLIAMFPYVFMRSNKEKLAFLIPTFLLYLVSPLSLIQFWIFVIGYHLFVYFVHLCRGNMINASRFYVALCSFSIAYFNTNDLRIALCFFVIQMIYYHETMKSFEWMKKDTHMPSPIYSLIAIGIVCMIIQYMTGYVEVFMTLGLIFICFGCSPLISITSFFLLNLIMPAISFEMFVYIFLLSLLKEQLGLMILVYFGLFMSQVQQIEQLLILGLYLVFLLLLSKEGIPVLNEIHSSNSNVFLHKQLMNFSLIFDHLGTYYESVSNIESNFLKSMSRALHYTSKKCIQDDRSADYIRNQVLSILEGYDIGYEEINVAVNESGHIQIECLLTHFGSSEVKEVLLPLLNHILPTPIECSSIRQSFLHPGVLHVEFISTPPIQIDAYADHAPTTCCGDSFSIFHHSRNVYCLISDGMGSGKEASKISKCIVNLFQRMIFSNIDEIEAMNCMNKLLLSDAYATCDVLSFDRYKKSVVICKSAANPTYLIRNKELFAIWGNSLPIGIVAHIDVDHIHVEVEKGDWFVMSSDGVHVEEILRWMKNSEDQSARKEVESFVEIMKENKRSDDSTILLAKVQ